MKPSRYPSELQSALDVDELARTMFGPMLLFTGVSHVSAAWAKPTTPAGDVCALITMAIRAETPKSAHDFFMLNVARARADAIVVTGKVLRAEPALRYTLQGPNVLPAALAEWRETRALRPESPQLIVLTSGRGLDPAHPALCGEWARPVIYTSNDSVLPELGAHVRVVRTAAPSARSAIGWARDQGAAIVSLETGPSTTLPLYRSNTIDELLLGVFRGPSLPSAVQLDTLFDESEPPLTAAGGPFVADEPSGPWTFQRYARHSIAML